MFAAVLDACCHNKEQPWFELFVSKAEPKPPHQTEQRNQNISILFFICREIPLGQNSRGRPHEYQIHLFPASMGVRVLLADDSIQAMIASSFVTPTIINQILRIGGRCRCQSMAPMPQSGRKMEPRSWNHCKGDRSCVNEPRMTKPWGKTRQPASLGQQGCDCMMLQRLQQRRRGLHLPLYEICR